MRPLARPNVTCAQVLKLCLDATSDAGLLARLRAISPYLDAAAATYDAQAVAETLNLIPRVASVGVVTKDELIELYSGNMSASKGAARWVYDQIRNSAPHKKCPLCGIGTVAVLDHHLPKAKYPDLAIVPNNLVPACHFCNDTKRARFPKSQGDQTLHPYFDARLLTGRWVKANLDKGPPLVLTYAASPPDNWSDIDRQRVQRHFIVCGLATTFTSNANDELSPLKERLVMLDERGGASAVQAYLEEEALGYRSRPNCWQLSMYEALAADVWFASGGFQSIS